METSVNFQKFPKIARLNRLFKVTIENDEIPKSLVKERE